MRMAVVVVALAALSAAVALLWLSPDPSYTFQEWIFSSRFHRYDALIVAAAQRKDLDPKLVKAIVWRESAFQPRKVGTSKERGLMQVSLAAAKDWAKAEKIETFSPADLFDPKTNLDAGVWYFHRALDHWKPKPDAVPFALAEYNAGRKGVERWLVQASLKDDASAEDLLAAISSTSTRQYIEDIEKRYQFYTKRGRL